MTPRDGGTQVCGDGIVAHDGSELGPQPRVAFIGLPRRGFPIQDRGACEDLLHRQSEARLCGRVALPPFSPPSQLAEALGTRTEVGQVVGQPGLE